MEDTPCEGERKKGANPTDGVRVPLNMDVLYEHYTFSLQSLLRL